MLRTGPALPNGRQSSPPATQWKHIALIVLLGGVLGWLPVRAYAAGLDCPELGTPGAVSNLLSDVQVKLVATGNSGDLANEIYDLINKLQIEKSNISYADLADILIAAYCPVIANLANLTASEKWRRMRQFDTILQRSSPPTRCRRDPSSSPTFRFHRPSTASSEARRRASIRHLRN